MAARFPQVSTHKISLGLLARLDRGAVARRKAWLLGVQPESLRPGTVEPGRQTLSLLELLAGD